MKLKRKKTKKIHIFEQNSNKFALKFKYNYVNQIKKRRGVEWLPSSAREIDLIGELISERRLETLENGARNRKRSTDRIKRVLNLTISIYKTLNRRD